MFYKLICIVHLNCPTEKNGPLLDNFATLLPENYCNQFLQLRNVNVTFIYPVLTLGMLFFLGFIWKTS